MLAATPSAASSKLEQSTCAQHTASSIATASATFTAPNLAGDLLLAGLVWKQMAGAGFPTGMTDSAGNTWVQQIPSNCTSNICVAAFAVESSAASPSNTVTATFSAAVNPTAIFIAEYSGMLTSSTLDVLSTGSGGASPLASGAAVTTYAPDLMFVVAVSSGGVPVPAAMLTVRETCWNAVIADELLATTGSKQATATGMGAWGISMTTWKVAPLAALGTPCTLASQCASEFCVDGVCCDSACGDGGVTDCIACSAGGVCGAVANLSPCDDALACTHSDSCSAGVCGGVAYACMAPECQVSACDGDGGCMLGAVTDGVGCDAGSCLSGSCVRISLDAGTSLDAGFDAGVDAGFDAGEPTVMDAGVDAGFDGGGSSAADAGVDGGFDGGLDLDNSDAGIPIAFLRAGCECTSGGGALGLWVFLLAAALRSRRRRE